MEMLMLETLLLLSLSLSVLHKGILSNISACRPLDVPVEVHRPSMCDDTHPCLTILLSRAPLSRARAVRVFSLSISLCKNLQRRRVGRTSVRRSRTTARCTVFSLRRKDHDFTQTFSCASSQSAHVAYLHMSMYGLVRLKKTGWGRSRNLVVEYLIARHFIVCHERMISMVKVIECRH